VRAGPAARMRPRDTDDARPGTAPPPLTATPAGVHTTPRRAVAGLSTATTGADRGRRLAHTVRPRADRAAGCGRGVARAGACDAAATCAGLRRGRGSGWEPAAGCPRGVACAGARDDAAPCAGLRRGRGSGWEPAAGCGQGVARAGARDDAAPCAGLRRGRGSGWGPAVGCGRVVCRVGFGDVVAPRRGRRGVGSGRVGSGDVVAVVAWGVVP
jgi:hypothetical protein